MATTQGLTFSTTETISGKGAAVPCCTDIATAVVPGFEAIVFVVGLGIETIGVAGADEHAARRTARPITANSDNRDAARKIFFFIALPPVTFSICNSFHFNDRVRPL
jgi:hypothetical protein